MPKLSSTLSEAELEPYKPIIKELLSVYRLRYASCIKVLWKFDLRIGTEALKYRVRKWGYQKNFTQEDYKRHARKQQRGLATPLSDRQSKDLAKKARGVKRHRFDLPSVNNSSNNWAMQSPHPVREIPDDDPSSQGLEGYDLQHPTVLPQLNPIESRFDWDDCLIPSEQVCTELTSMLQNQTAILPSSFLCADEDDSGYPSAVLKERTIDLRPIIEHIVGKRARLNPKLDLTKVSRPRIPSYNAGNLQNWNLKFLQAFINYVVFMSNNNFLENQPVSHLFWNLGNLSELRELVVWIISKYPTVTRAFENLLFRRTIHTNEESRALDLLNFTSNRSEDLIIHHVLKNGNLWCLKALIRQNIIFKDRDMRRWNPEIPNDAIRQYLDTIILSPKIFTFQTILKICEILGNSIDEPSSDLLAKYSLLNKYSDSNYRDRDLGTKLFLLASYMIDNYTITSRGFNKGSTHDYEKLAQYILEHCVNDYTKALINTIWPISYLEKFSEVRKRTDPTLNTRRPLLSKFCSHKGIILLKSKVDINSIWKDRKGRDHHVLTLALKHNLPPHVIGFLLDEGADVHVVTSGWHLNTSCSEIEVAGTPLNHAISSRNMANLQLVLSRLPEITDSLVCVLLACQSKYPRRRDLYEISDGDYSGYDSSGRSGDWGSLVFGVMGIDYIGSGPNHAAIGTANHLRQDRSALMRVLGIFLPEKGPIFEAVARRNDTYEIIANERQDILEHLVAARTEPVPVDIIFKALKAKKARLFRLMLPAWGLDGGQSLRRLVVLQVLEKLEHDPTADDLFCIHRYHKYKSMAAHRPVMMYELWDEILENKIDLSLQLRQRMTAPIFWSTVWDDGPYWRRARALLREILRVPLSLHLGLSDVLKEALKYSQRGLLDTLSHRFGKQHARCFDRAVAVAVDLGWDLNQKNEYGLTVLHFATAVSGKTVQNLITRYARHVNTTNLSLEGKVKLLILASYYGHRDLVRILLEETKGNQNLVNKAGTLGNFNPLKPSDLQHPIQGWTTALHVATFQRRKDIICLLLANGADIDMTVPRSGKGNEGTMGTALDIAAAQGSADIVDVLLRHRPEAWRLAARLASEKRHHEICKTIENYGRNFT
ncbi:hypothetical protein TWF281_009602 [Arthrobotrys megalospora]